MDRALRVVPDGPSGRLHDPLAVAVANASFLGVGYLMLGRRLLAMVTGLVTVVLFGLLASSQRTVGFEVAVLIWWADLVAHGWFLAGGRTRRVVRWQWVVALAVTVPVLLAVGLLRVDAGRIEHAVAQARHEGDCGHARSALDRVRFGHRIADAPLTARVQDTARVCHQLSAVADTLTVALDRGDTVALATGVNELTTVLSRHPGHDRMVQATVDQFLDRLPTKNPCDTAEITDWLHQHPPLRSAADHSAAVVTRTAPAALVACADQLLAVNQWDQARTRYQQLITQYPRHPLTARARAGIRKADLGLELEKVRGLLQTGPGSQPPYCSTPARYSAAAPYHRGTNRALFYGNNQYTDRLPSGWKAADVANAVLVVCVGDQQLGTPVGTCPYQDAHAPGGSTDVTFHRIRIPVKAYELRTGKRVVDTTVEISGTSCPSILSYTTYGADLGPPSDEYVSESTGDVRAAFRPVITR